MFARDLVVAAAPNRRARRAVRSYLTGASRPTRAQNHRVWNSDERWYVQPKPGRTGEHFDLFNRNDQPATAAERARYDEMREWYVAASDRLTAEMVAQSEESQRTVVAWVDACEAAGLDPYGNAASAEVMRQQLALHRRPAGVPVARRPRARGAGRPRVRAVRSASRSGGSGDDGSGLAGGEDPPGSRATTSRRREVGR